jgi:hypothetical protein
LVLDSEDKSDDFVSCPEELGSNNSDNSFVDPMETQGRFGDMTDVYSNRMKAILNCCQPYPGDVDDEWATQEPVDGPRFDIVRFDLCGTCSCYYHVSIEGSCLTYVTHPQRQLPTTQKIRSCRGAISDYD